MQIDVETDQTVTDEIFGLSVPFSLSLREIYHLESNLTENPPKSNFPALGIQLFFCRNYFHQQKRFPTFVRDAAGTESDEGSAFSTPSLEREDNSVSEARESEVEKKLLPSAPSSRVDEIWSGG